MNEAVLPPAPNWYLNNILVCSKRGTLAWGAKNFIIIAKHEEGHPNLQFSLIKDFCKDRVTALAFCPNLDSPELLIVGGDEDKVRILSMDTLQVIVEFSFKDSKSVVGVDWSAKDSNLAYVLNSEGFLMRCYISYETSKIISLGKLTATCLACCPHDPYLVAVGTKSGLIYIVQKETILYKLRGHNEEIVSLSWCPSDVNVLSGNNKKDLLLASGAKDRTVFIWRAGGDGRYETMISIPNMPFPNSSHKGKLGTTTGTWIAVCWVEPKVLLTSSLWGELLSWDLSTSKNNPNLFHTYHSRGLFCIAPVPKNDKISDNWRTKSELVVWTLAQDRWIICCKQNSDPSKPATLEYKIPTQGGFIYCMAACPIDTSRIVFGVGDAMLRLWNLSEPHTKTFDVVSHWQKIRGKIRAVSWFPDDESTVAFGTSEGRIGVFDAIGTNKPPILYRQYHRNIVYKLEWAKLESEYFLFSCAEGELVAHKKSAPHGDPMSIIMEGCTEFAWKSNLCLAIALENGSIMFYDQKLRKRNSTIHILRSMVNCLAWHPDSTSTDEWISSNANYLAVAFDSNIIICDMSELIKEIEANPEDCNEEDNNEERKLYKMVATLNGHIDKVVCLAWSPHVSGYLVSGSYDNVAQVWNVEKKELMGTYIGHDGPVLCCMWSPLKPQLIMTGSSDFMLRIWDYTLAEQSPKQMSDIKLLKKKQKSQKKSSKSKTNGENNPTMSDNESVTYTKFESAPVKKKERRTYFNEYNKMINDKSRVKNHILNFIINDIRGNQQEEEQQEENDITNLSLFSKKEHLLKLINEEKSSQSNLNAITEMNMWCENLENNLICAAKDKQLNDFLVSLAPQVSMKMWREMCEAYAHQLMNQCNVEKAVSYLLCIHKIYEAIDAFLQANMYKEAYVLARCRLDSNDSFLTKILESWSDWSASNGQLEQAAHCRVELKQFDKAAKILARRKDIYSLEVASELAFLSGDEGYGLSLIMDAVTRSLVKSEWAKARSLITNLRQIQYLNAHIDAHEAIMSTYKTQNKLDLMRSWLERKEQYGALQTLQMKYDTSYYAILCKNENTNTFRNEAKDTMMQLNATYRIAIAATCDAKETQLKHIAAILDDVFEFEKMAVEYGTVTTESLFIHILAKLDIRKPTDEGSIYAKSNYPISQSIRAYLCVGLLNLLLNYSILSRLSFEEETQFTQLILELLDDAINETTLSYKEKIPKLRQLGNQLLSLLLVDAESDNCKRIKDEIEKLKFDEIKFKEERVCMPDPKIVYDKVYLLTNKLNDDTNKLLLSQALDKFVKLVKEKEIKPFELKGNPSEMLENTSQENIDENISEQCEMECEMES
ncbi:Gem-associated protein 5 [Camponotus japonicus]